jgi:PKD repeat protein
MTAVFGAILDVMWDWGDGSGTTTGTPATHSYNTSGTYTISYSGQFVSGALYSGTYDPNITVTAPANSSAFTYTPSSGIAPLLVTFSGISAGSPLTWEWDFGDGGTSNIQNPIYTFVTGGTFIVQLTNTWESGTTPTSITHSVVVAAPNAIAVSATPTTGDAPLSVTFDRVSQTGFLDALLWTFGDGTTSASFVPTHDYLLPGTFHPYVTAYFTGGTSPIIAYTADVVVTGVPVAVSDFAYLPATISANSLVTFTNLSTDATSYQWSFGDGNMSVLESPTHTYALPGDFMVTLTAANNTSINSKSMSLFVESTNVVEFSNGLLDQLFVDILNFNATHSVANISQCGLLPSGSDAPTDAHGYITIMQGVMPATPDLISIPSVDVLAEFSVESGVFDVQANKNPVVISTMYIPATATGAATWFVWSVRNNTGTIYQQAIGTVGLSNSTADLKINDTDIVSGNYYRILNIRLSFPSLFEL